MARSNATFAKRQKERARQEKQRAKMERRQQRKLEKTSSPDGEPVTVQEDGQVENPVIEQQIEEESA